MFGMWMYQHCLMLKLMVRVPKEISLEMQMRKCMGSESEYSKVERRKLLMINADSLLPQLQTTLYWLGILQSLLFSYSVCVPTAHSSSILPYLDPSWNSALANSVHPSSTLLSMTINYFLWPDFESHLSNCLEFLISLRLFWISVSWIGSLPFDFVRWVETHLMLL